MAWKCLWHSRSTTVIWKSWCTAVRFLGPTKRRVYPMRSPVGSMTEERRLRSYHWGRIMFHQWRGCDRGRSSIMTGVDGQALKLSTHFVSWAVLHFCFSLSSGLLVSLQIYWASFSVVESQSNSSVLVALMWIPFRPSLSLEIGSPLEAILRNFGAELYSRAWYARSEVADWRGWHKSVIWDVIALCSLTGTVLPSYRGVLFHLQSALPIAYPVRCDDCSMLCWFSFMCDWHHP